MLCPRTFCLAKLWESIFNMCDVEGFWPSTSPIAFWTSLRLSPASQRHFVSTLSKFATSTAYGSCFPKTPRSSERRTWNDGRPRLYWQENPCSGPTTTAIFLPCYVGSNWLSDDRPSGSPVNLGVVAGSLIRCPAARQPVPRPAIAALLREPDP